MLFIAYYENTATYSHRMEPKHLSPPRHLLSNHRPLSSPRQLLDCGTWHQQQLKQLAAFLTPHTQWFISQLKLTVYSTGILERIKKFSIPKSFI
jgi:hypothetical protein